MKLRNVDILDAIIDNLDSEISLVETTAVTQLACKHGNVAECDYVPEGAVTNGFPPNRVCIDCGLAEEGWYFRALPNELVYKISRDQYYSIRTGLTVTDSPRHRIGPEDDDAISDKTALVRKLCTLEQLIEDWKEMRLAHLKKKREEHVSAISGTK